MAGKGGAPGCLQPRSGPAFPRSFPILPARPCFVPGRGAPSSPAPQTAGPGAPPASRDFSWRPVDPGANFPRAGPGARGPAAAAASAQPGLPGHSANFGPGAPAPAGGLGPRSAVPPRPFLPRRRPGARPTCTPWPPLRRRRRRAFWPSPALRRTLGSTVPESIAFGVLLLFFLKQYECNKGLSKKEQRTNWFDCFSPV